MAGSVATLTYDDLGSIRKVILDWTSDDSAGTVTAVTKKITGRLIKTITNPGGTAPSANYDIAITDGEAFDVLTNCQNSLLNRHTSSTEEVYHYLKNADTTPIGIAAFPVVSDILTIAITAAGNSKTGRLVLFYEHVNP
jgi:hypothetical protein